MRWLWEPLGLDEVVRLLDAFPAPWWIAGGHALDLFAGRALRPHEDVDVLVRRDDQRAILDHLAGWDVRIAHDGRLEPWHGERIELPRQGLWARSDPRGPWQLDFLLAETEGDDWWFRRDPAVRLALAELGARSPAGIPYLRPEVVLLFKAKDPRDRDERDLEAVRPLLDEVSRRRLEAWLPPGHSWRNRIRERGVY